MPTLALDTSSAVSVAVVDADETLAAETEYAPRGHAELLSPMIRRVLARAGVDASGGVTEVVVGTGPAPFTGLRVGLVTARTLGLAWGVPVYGVCSLDALGAAHGGSVTVVADARRREVYWATYDAGERVAGPGVCRPGDVPVRGAIVGRGAALYPEAFPGAPAEGPRDPDPAWLARLAARRLAAGGERPRRRAPLPQEAGRSRDSGRMSGAASVALRDLAPEDLAWVAEREREIFGASAWSLRLIEDDFAHGFRRYRGIEVDGSLAGYAVYGFDGDAFHLMNLAIAPAVPRARARQAPGRGLPRGGARDRESARRGSRSRSRTTRRSRCIALTDSRTCACERATTSRRALTRSSCGCAWIPGERHERA